MIEKVCRAIERWNMLEEASCVAVGLSGGADSVSLLHSLYSLREKYGFSLRAVHVNHGIRGEAADRDEAFCVEFCEKLGIPIEVFHFDVPAIAARQGKGLEECGRCCRYECFEKICEKYSCRIATAHTLSDSAETMLLNIARGCGISGLRGIPAVRGNIIRPLILCSREDVEQYCAENGLSFVTDETNFDDAYSRNRVRLNIIPELKKLNPDFLEAAARLSDSAAADEQYLRENTVKALSFAANEDGKSWKVDEIKEFPAAIRRRAIIEICETLFDKSPDFTHIQLVESVINAGSGAVTLGKDAVLTVFNGMLCAAVKHEAAGEWKLAAAERLTLPDGREAFVERVTYDEFVNRAKNNKLLFKSAVGCDIISVNTFLRNRREGDFFSPAGRGVTKKVKKLFNEAHVPAEERGRLVIAEQDGRIIWIERFGAAQGMKPSPECGCVSIISFRK